MFGFFSPPPSNNKPEDKPGDEDMPDLDELDAETLKLAAWQIDVLIRAGFDTYWAGKLAAIPALDYRQAITLHQAGCPQALVEELLR